MATSRDPFKLNLPSAIAPLRIGDWVLFNIPRSGHWPESGALFRVGIMYFRAVLSWRGLVLAKRYRSWER